MVRWEAKTQLGNVHVGFADDGSWKKLPDILSCRKDKIIHLRLSSAMGESDIDNNADGYFLGNKAIVEITNGSQLHLVGIGYWKQNDDKVRIKWHNAQTLELLEVEARSLDKCGFFFIKNPI